MVLSQNRIHANPHDLGGWFTLLMFPLWCLRLTPGKYKRAQDLEIRDRCRRFRAGDWANLQAEFEEQAQKLSENAMEDPTAGRPERTEEEKQVALFKRVLKLIKAGQLSRAAQLLTPSAPAPRTEATKQALVSLHPAPDDPLPAWLHSFEPTEPLAVEVEEQLKAYNDAPHLSAAGPSGWTFEHLRDIFPEEERSTGVMNLTQIITHITTGNIPEAVVQALASSRLHALAKPNSTGVRPVAVGEVWTRLASKAIASHLSHDFQEALQPFQLGVAVPGGSEAVVLGIRAALEANPDWTLVAMDVSNAFNSIHRSAIFEALQEGGPRLQSLIPYVRAMYGKPTPLWYKDGPGTVFKVLSRTGTRQGDPLAGALFAMGHLRILKKTHQDNPHCYLPTIADDTYLVGPAESVKQAYQGFITEAATVGLAVKNTKCVQYFPMGATDEQKQHLIEGVEVLEGGLTILGSPLGNEEFVLEALDKSLRHKGKGLVSLPLLQDSQAAFTLLLKCFLPRIHYMLRCTPLSPAGMTRVTAYHKELLHTMEILMGFTPGTMPRQARKQAELPIAHGGMGIIPPLHVAPAAILGAWALSSSRLPRLFPGNRPMEAFVAEADTGDRPLQRHLQQTRTIFSHVLPTLPTLADIAAEPITKLQAQCSAKLGEYLHTLHLDSLQTPDDQARFRSASCRHAGAWIEAGGTYKDTRMTSDEFATGMRLRLGLPHPQMAGLTKCLCKAESDALGHHHLHCPNGKGLTLAHNSVRDSLASIFRRAGYNVLLEKRGQLLMGGEESRERQRTDLVLTKAGIKILVDVTIRDPTALFIV